MKLETKHQKQTELVTYRIPQAIICKEGGAFIQIFYFLQAIYWSEIACTIIYFKSYVSLSFLPHFEDIS